MAEKKEPEMEYRFLGNSGLQVSVLSFGAWITQGSQVEDDIAFECMKTAFDMGCNFFDNAEVYAGGKAEETMGRCIKRLGVDRSQLVVSTKIFWGGKGVNQTGLSRKHIIEACDKSLKRLDLDYVDLLFCHRPDKFTPIEETVRAMNFLIEQGKTFYWGTSEWSADQLMQAHAVATRLGLIGPLMEQPQYSMFHRTRVEKEYSRLYSEIGLGTTIWSPLAGGLLTGKYTSRELPADSRYAFSKTKVFRDQLLNNEGVNGLEEKNFDLILKKVADLKPIADKLECTVAQLAIAWCAKNPQVSTVITGASRVSQVVENFKALSVVPKLTPQVLEQIEAVLQNKPAEHTKDFR
jgi:voltage-dependent potassium channel beta subunit